MTTMGLGKLIEILEQGGCDICGNDEPPCPFEAAVSALLAGRPVGETE